MSVNNSITCRKLYVGNFMKTIKIISWMSKRGIAMSKNGNKWTNSFELLWSDL